MDRIANINETSVTNFRTELQGFYPDNEKPLPGSRLQVDDDVLWLGMFPVRVLWGHDHPLWFNGYCPDYFGDFVINIEGQYIADRAPADPQDLPAMPLYAEQARAGGDAQLQQQEQQNQSPQNPDGKHGGRGKPTLSDEQRALQAVLAQVHPRERRKVLEKVRAVRPELLTNGGK